MLEVGDKVLINPKSEYYTSDCNNPMKTFGEVVQAIHYYDHGIRVEWDNGEVNSYNELDLVPVIDKCEVIYEEGHIYIKSNYMVFISSSSKRRSISHREPILPTDFLNKFKEITQAGYKIKYVTVEYDKNLKIKTLSINLKENLVEQS